MFQFEKVVTLDEFSCFLAVFDLSDTGLITRGSWPNRVNYGQKESIMHKRVNNGRPELINGQKHVRRPYPETSPETDENRRKQSENSQFHVQPVYIKSGLNRISWRLWHERADVPVTLTQECHPMHSHKPHSRQLNSSNSVITEQRRSNILTHSRNTLDAHRLSTRSNEQL